MKKVYKNRKISAIVISVICAVIALSAVIFARDYNLARLVFSGMNMTMSADADNSIQGYVNVSLEKINAEAVTFTLHYDKRYLEPSSYADNSVTDKPSKAFKINPDIKDYISYYDLTFDYISSIKEDEPNPETGEVEGGRLTITLNVDQTYSGEDNSIIKTEIDPDIVNGDGSGDPIQHVQLIADNNVGLSLGDLSFRINDPAEFAKLTKEQIKKDVLYITSVTSDGVEHPDIAITYYDPDDEVAMHTKAHRTTEYVNYKWEITQEVISVKPVKDNVHVLAPELYYTSNHTASEQDLIDYANKYLNKLYVKYTTNNEVIENIVWGDTTKDFKITRKDGTGYEATCGEYELSQMYGEKEVKLTIITDPVKLTGFTADPNKLSRTYPSADFIPEKDEDLDLPVDAYATTDRIYDQIDVIAAVGDWTYSPASDDTGEEISMVDDMRNLVGEGNSEFTFTGNIDTSSLSSEYPWLTVGDDSYTLTAKRYVKDVSGKPDGVSSVVDDDSGDLIITVDGLVPDKSPIPEGTEFNIYFPDGTIIPTTDNGVTVTREDGSNGVTIRIDADELSGFDAPAQQAIQEMINIGGIDFAISSIEPDKGESETAQFDVYRNNFYTEDVELDFSDEAKSHKSSMYKLAAETPISKISTYVEFVTASIPTTYHGITGEMPGNMESAKVKSWTLLDADGVSVLNDDDGNPLTALPAEGTTCWLEGEFETYTYNSYGLVIENNKKLRIKITTSAKNPDDVTEAITVTDDAVTYDIDTPYNFGLLQEHYPAENTPVHQFTINNIGTTAINGLKVNASGSDFVIAQKPADILPLDGTTKFELRPKHNLPSGTYETWIYVSSNNSTEKTAPDSDTPSYDGYLQCFKVTVKITNGDICKLIVKPNNSLWGVVNLPDGENYVKDDIATFKVTPNNFYAFDYDPADLDYSKKCFTAVPSGVQINHVSYDLNTNTYTFNVKIEKNYTQITVNFEETIEAKLLLEELHVYDKAGNEILPLQIEAPDPANPAKTILKDSVFIPTQLEYWVNVKGTNDEASLKTKPLYEKIGEKYIDNSGKLFYTQSETGNPSVDSDGTVITPPTVGVYYDFTTKWLNVDPFKIISLPDENTLELKRSYNIDGTEHAVTYKIHIIRRPAVNVTFNYGNSPYGLIMRDSAITDNNKAAALKEFKDNRKFINYVPSVMNTIDPTNKILYTSEAWGDNSVSTYYNGDTDDSSIFVYVGDDMNMLDPGWIGDVTNYQDIVINPEDITRTISLLQYTSTLENSADIHAFYNSVQEKIYSFTGAGSSIKSNVTMKGKAADGTTTYSTSEQNINGIMTYNGMDNADFRPGVYKIEYSFIDPADNQLTSFERKLIVLARPGNLLSAKAETLAQHDYSLIYNYNKNLLAQDLISTADEPWKMLLSYRVMDVNMDRNINSIDANGIRTEVNKGNNTLLKRTYVPTSVFLTQEGGGS